METRTTFKTLPMPSCDTSKVASPTAHGNPDTVTERRPGHSRDHVPQRGTHRCPGEARAAGDCRAGGDPKRPRRTAQKPSRIQGVDSARPPLNQTRPPSPIGAGTGNCFWTGERPSGTVWDRLRRIGRVQWQQPKAPRGPLLLDVPQGDLVGLLMFRVIRQADDLVVTVPPVLGPRRQVGVVVV